MSDDEVIRVPSSELVSVTVQRQEVTTVVLEIPFYSENDAKIAYNSLRIDKEPPRGNVVKELTLMGDHLHVKIASKDIKRLRSSTTSFLDYAILVVNTLNKFGTYDYNETEEEPE